MPMVGHFGVDETRELVFRRYRWPHLCNFVEGYTCSCNALCQIEESATLTILVTMTIANSSQLVGVYLFGFHCKSDSLVFHESMPFGCTSFHASKTIKSQDTIMARQKGSNWRDVELEGEEVTVDK